MNSLSTYLLRRIADAGGDKLLVGNARCMRQQWSGAELHEAVREFAAGLLALGIERGQKVGIVADNADFWIIADLACLAIGAIDVPRAADTSPDEIAFVLKHSCCEAVIVESREVYQSMVASLAQCPRIKTSIVCDGLEFDQLQGLIDQTVVDGRWLILCGHEIGQGDFQTTLADTLRVLCAYLCRHEDNLWVDTVAAVGKYILQKRIFA